MLARLRTPGLPIDTAILAADKVQVTIIIAAVHESFALNLAVAAVSDDLVVRCICVESHQDTLIKDVKFAFEMLVRVTLHVGYDTVF